MVIDLHSPVWTDLETNKGSLVTIEGCMNFNQMDGDIYF